MDYIHIMCDQHEVIMSDGIWTESFQPGDQTLAGMDAAQRYELELLFAELAPGGAGFAAVRRTLRRHEADLLLA
jgi:Hint domain